MAAQPHTLSWQDPTTYADGSVLDTSLIVGYEIQIDAVGIVSIPKQAGNTFDLTTLASWTTLKAGTHTVMLAVVLSAAANSAVGAFGTATFPIFGTPTAPTHLAVA